MTRTGVVIVGASLAGAHTALELRRIGYEAPITLVGTEPHLPYERPELSKGFLAGDVAQDRLLVAPGTAYSDGGIELRLGATASGVDVIGRRVQLADGQVLSYEALVVATGSVNIRPRLAGMDLPGVSQLRTIDEARALASLATRDSRVVVVGAGFVGCEVAATLAGRVRSVTAVDPLPGPLWGALGPELSTLVRGWHEEHGVVIAGGVGVAAIGGEGRAQWVRLDDDRTLEADVVVVGVGARPAIGWLENAGLQLAAGGLAVDADLRTSAADIYAAGDVAAVRAAGSGGHRRTEHYSSAIAQARGAAHSIAGATPPPAEPGWFWSHQYGHYLQYAGAHAAQDERVVRPAPYAAFFLRDAVLRAVATVDNGRDLRRAMPLLGRVIDPLLLADAAVDLRTVG